MEKREGMDRSAGRRTHLSRLGRGAVRRWYGQIGDEARHGAIRQAHRLRRRTDAADRRNPYVYAQTVPDLLRLVQRADGLARVAATGYETVVKIIAPKDDYWPLPWYLRRFKHVGFYDKLPEDPFAPIVVISSKLDAQLDAKSGKKWIMAGLSELRPGVFFELYVELELWKKYVETLPRDRD